MNRFSAVSDGYHTFDELYAHRDLLFILLMQANREKAWYADRHHNGSSFPDHFLGGIDLPTGTITYHLPECRRNFCASLRHLDLAPEWDGHTPSDVLNRMASYAVGPDVRNGEIGFYIDAHAIDRFHERVAPWVCEEDIWQELREALAEVNLDAVRTRPENEYGPLTFIPHIRGVYIYKMVLVQQNPHTYILQSILKHGRSGTNRRDQVADRKRRGVQRSITTTTFRRMI